MAFSAARTVLTPADYREAAFLYYRQIENDHGWEQARILVIQTTGIDVGFEKLSAGFRYIKRLGIPIVQATFYRIFERCEATGKPYRVDSEGNYDLAELNVIEKPKVEITTSHGFVRIRQL